MSVGFGEAFEVARERALEDLTSTVGRARACAAVGVNRATWYRRNRLSPVPPRPERPRRPHPRALTAIERAEVVATLNSPRFADPAPAQVWATLLDEGVHPCSESTMHRILRERGEVRERRRQAAHPPGVKPELVAKAPNPVWPWDVTKPRGPDRRVFFCLYTMIDIYSRYTVGRMVADRRHEKLARQFVTETVARSTRLPTPSPASAAVHCTTSGTSPGPSPCTGKRWSCGRTSAGLAAAPSPGTTWASPDESSATTPKPSATARRHSGRFGRATTVGGQADVLLGPGYTSRPRRPPRHRAPPRTGPGPVPRPRQPPRPSPGPDSAGQHPPHPRPPTHPLGRRRVQGVRMIHGRARGNRRRVCPVRPFCANSSEHLCRDRGDEGTVEPSEHLIGFIHRGPCLRGKLVGIEQVG